MMKKYMEKSSWEDKDIAKPMEQILQTMEAVQSVYSCMKEIREGILNSMNAQNDHSETQQDYAMELDLELMDLPSSIWTLISGSFIATMRSIQRNHHLVEWQLLNLP